MSTSYTDVAESWGNTIASNFDSSNKNSIGNQLSNNLSESEYAVSISEEETAAVSNAASELGTALTAKYEGKETLNDVIGTATAVGTELVADAFEEFKKSLLATRRVKIKSLINSVGACATQTPQEFVDNLSDKFNELGNALPKALAQLAIQYGSAIASDPRFQESVNDLAVVQYYSNVVEKAYGMYNSVMKIVDKFEPYFPVIEIIVSAAAIWSTGGASAAAFTSESAMLAAQELKKAIPLIVTPLKKMLYDTEVEVPAFLLGVLDFASSDVAKSSFAAQLQRAEELAMIDDASFAEVNKGLKFPTAYNSITNAIGTSPRTSAFIYNILRTVVPAKLAREIFGSIGLYDQVQRSYRPALALAERNLATDVIVISEAEAKLISKKIVDSRDTTAAFYTDRQMHKLILEQLKADGCIIDLDAQAYDEYRTYLSGEGDRAAFKKLNDRITAYHTLLELITGEVRANIVEDIPVIDFHKKNRTSITAKYADTSSFSSTIPITTLPKEGANAYVVSGDPPEFSVNLAVSGYSVAEYFYNNVSRTADEKNIVVEHSSNASPTAPGILNGLFSTPQTRDAYGNVTSWVWDTNTAGLPLGTRYNPYHIWDGQVELALRTIVERPLATTTPGFAGKATEWFTDVTTFINTEIVERFSIAAATWRTLGGKLKSVTPASYSRNAGVTVISRIITERYTTRIRGNKKAGIEPEVIERVRYKHLHFVRLVSNTSYYPAKLGNLGSLNPAVWTSKMQTIGGKSYIVINTTTMGNTVQVITGKSNAEEEKIRAEEKMLSSATAMFSAAVKDWDPLIGERRMQIASINIISPFEVVRNKVQRNGDTILYSQGDGTTLQSEMWLLSKKNLGFSLDSNGQKALCIFHDNANALAFQVTAIDYFDPSASNFQVITSAGTYTFESGVSTYAAPQVKIFGTACWIYKLAPIQVSDPDLVADFYPLRSPLNFFALRRRTSSFASNTLNDLLDISISVSLPALSGESDKYANYWRGGVSLRPIDKLLGRDVVSNYIRGKLKVLPIMSISGSPNITLEQFENFVAPWTRVQSTLRRLAETSVPELSKLVANIPKMQAAAKAVNAMLLGAGTITLTSCAAADELLGNESTPWFSIGDDPSDLISESTMSSLVAAIKTALEGTAAGGASVPVRYLPGSSYVEGRIDSLYYQRYLFLNNRMNRSDGTLAKAEMLLYNWEFLKNSDIFKNRQLSAYMPFIDAEEVVSMDGMIYLPPSGDETEGYFYIKEIVDAVQSEISDKCLLICSACPVQKECPFYDEASVLKKYLPVASHLNLWFKDNELDLLVYEPGADGQDYLDVKSSTGTRILASEMKARHKLYTEIIRDEDKELNLDTVREKIASQVNGYSKDVDIYADGLDWLTGGRYGSLQLRKDDKGTYQDPDKHSYLYDALFIRDEETAFNYAPTTSAYEVSMNLIEDGEEVNYSGKVRIKEPTDLLMLVDAAAESDVYLISDDTTNALGEPINACIYLNTLGELDYDFDFDRSDKQITSDADVRRWPSAADIAQWCINEYKWMDPTPDQYWMENIQKVVRASRASGTAIVNLPGRPRIADVVDPLITKEPSIEDLARGKLMIKSYINFIRKMRIDLNSIRWVKGSNLQKDIEKAKQTLAAMKTNLRLVVVKK